MATSGDAAKRRLSNKQVVSVAEAISPKDMKTIAMGYMDINPETIETVHDENPRNLAGFKRKILRIWMYKHSRGDQVKVSRIPFLMFLHLSVILFTGERGSLSGGSLSKGRFLSKGGLCQREPPYGNMQTVRILLECILVFGKYFVKN